jgi:hypothetical protein
VRPLPCEEQRLASQTARGRYLGLGGCVGERRRRWRQRSPVVEQDVVRAVRGIGGGVATTPSGGLVAAVAAAPIIKVRAWGCLARHRR